MAWQTAAGYHHRALAKAVMDRYKRVIGVALCPRTAAFALGAGLCTPAETRASMEEITMRAAA